MNITRNINCLKDVPTQVKNKDLVALRRRQIVDAAVELFIANGFHKTTTRQLARAAGLSIGSLYEYVESKEDILYLVCDAIHAEVEQGVAQALERAQTVANPLGEVIREYFKVCHEMNDHILLIYQETQSLPSKWRKVVLENEIRITGLFTSVLMQLMEDGQLIQMDGNCLDLIAHNITVLGHMWTFRRWFLARHYTLDQYVDMQTAFILGQQNVAVKRPPASKRKITKKEF
ncbi:MAG: TetR/AcrR family transcriptional regulator [Desulfobacteraceae bacterium]|nr:TetR/AcrR family transcriptional regulator [Desulfobacteraceae bacterium]